MGIVLPSRLRKRIKKIEPILTDNDINISLKQKLLFIELKNFLFFLREPIIKQYNLEYDEITSEIFIIIARILRNYNPQKSSFIPYIERYLIFEIEKMFKRFNKKYKDSLLYMPIENSYYMPDEIYLKSPESLIFEERYLGKLFTRDEKRVIQEILHSNTINYMNISRITNIDFRTIKNKVYSIQDKLTKELM